MHNTYTGLKNICYYVCGRMHVRMCGKMSIHLKQKKKKLEAHDDDEEEEIIMKKANLSKILNPSKLFNEEINWWERKFMVFTSCILNGKSINHPTAL